ncbi:MAG: hypothetical protein GXO77_17165 [Calditrichaeota bacterium]|nr:hypothetical protein [Calditrichota bacterium]
MKLIALTDLHDHSQNIDKIGKDLSEADWVIVAGDITTFGNAGDARQIIDKIFNYNRKILAVPGNCDPDSVALYLTKIGVNLDNRVRSNDEYYFMGIGGSLPAPGRTPNEYNENLLQLWLQKFKTQLPDGAKIILISHQPPYGTINDRVLGGEQVGSKTLRKFIEELQPLICFTGHIHEGVGIDRIGRTKIINPGPFRQGGYVYAEINGENVRLELRSCF